MNNTAICNLVRICCWAASLSVGLMVHSPVRADVGSLASGSQAIFFPSVGAERPTVVVEYFYRYDCHPCFAASSDILELLSQFEGLSVIFHPVVMNDLDAALAVIENAAFADGSKAFYATHLSLLDLVTSEASEGGSMEDHELVDDLIGSLVALEVVQPEDFLKRLTAPEAWSGNLALNKAMVADLGLNVTPSFVVNGVKLEGYADIGQLTEAVSTAAARLSPAKTP